MVDYDPALGESCKNVVKFDNLQQTTSGGLNDPASDEFCKNVDMFENFRSRPVVDFMILLR